MLSKGSNSHSQRVASPDSDLGLSDLKPMPLTPVLCQFLSFWTVQFRGGNSCDSDYCQGSSPLDDLRKVL